MDSPYTAAGVKRRLGRGFSLALAASLALVAAGCAKGVHPGGSASGGTTTTIAGSVGEGPGLTSKSITIGNVATVGGPVPGLFEGARYGVEAYADYVNSQGGIDGRKLIVSTGDDQLNCTQNQTATTSMLPNVAAFVGNFSLFDSCGFDKIPATVPYVGVSLNTTMNVAPNFFSPQPILHGWSLGGLQWLKQHYPTAVLHVGALVADVQPAPDSWKAEEAAMKSLGFGVSVVESYGPFDTQFAADVLTMQRAGVQMVVLDQADGATAARFVDAIQLAGFHPQVVTSSGTAYDSTFIQQAGSAAASMVTVVQGEALYLGQDAASIPAIATFDHWYGVAFPGHQPDIYALYGWASAELFAQAVRSAGHTVDQATILAALRKITSFDAGGMLAPADPAGHQPPHCFILARVLNGNWQRFDDPASGFNCTGSYYIAKS